MKKTPTINFLVFFSEHIATTELICFPRYIKEMLVSSARGFFFFFFKKKNVELFRLYVFRATSFSLGRVGSMSPMDYMHNIIFFFLIDKEHYYYQVQRKMGQSNKVHFNIIASADNFK